MLRVVLDTNVLVSALLHDRGNEARAVRLVRGGFLLACASPAILNEYERVLYRPSFRFQTEFVKQYLGSLRSQTLIVTPGNVVMASPDEPDNRFLECAETAKADFLVTGNKRHFPSHWKSTKVVNARELLLEIIL
jgi:putative PIN family toxin of toxin-antitoxin system